MSLSSQCHALLPLVPILLNFFRQSGDISGESFISPSKSADAESRPKIEQMIENLHENLEQEERLTITQIKFVYTNFDENLWPRAVLTILSASSPRLIPEKKCSDLATTFKKSRQEILSNIQSCGGLLGPILDEVPRNHFEVLGGFFAYIRDHSQDITVVSKALGKSIFAGVTAKDAKDLFLVLAENAEPLFGRVATPKTNLAL